MITRFDHAVVAVRDLDQAMEQYRALGFEVAPGGAHPRWGTRNALVRFGADYLELLAVADERAARESGPGGRALLAFLRDREGGLAGYALAVDDADAEAARLRAAGLEVGDPYAMARERPDRRVLGWRLAVPEDMPWRRPWPFLIWWDEPDEVRLAEEPAGGHPNGATRVAGVSVAVRDPEAAVGLYEALLGSPAAERDEVAQLGAERVRFSAVGIGIELLAPARDGVVREVLDAAGEGFFEVRLATADLTATAAYLAVEGVAYMAAEGEDAIVVPPELAAGARLAFVAADAA